MNTERTDTGIARRCEGHEERTREIFHALRAEALFDQLGAKEKSHVSTPPLDLEICGAAEDEELGDLAQYFSEMMRTWAGQQQVRLKRGAPMISYLDCLTHGDHIVQCAYNMWLKRHRLGAALLTACKPLEEALDGEGSIFDQFDRKLHCLLAQHSSFEERFLYVDKEGWLPGTQALTRVHHHRYVVHSKVAESRMVTAKHGPRKVYRVGAIDHHGNTRHWAEVAQTPDHSGPKPVYIQAHAIQRLRGRLSPAPWGLIHVILNESLLNPEIIQQGTGSGLIALRSRCGKLGYLGVEFRKDMVLIKTFLLLTQSCTPEGNAMSKVLGIDRNDLAYLRLNTLRAFVETDVAEHPVLKDIMRSCGCRGMLNFARHARPAGFKLRTHAHRISEYLMLEERELEIW